MAAAYPVLAYYNALAKIFNKETDLDSDDIRAALVTSAYTPDRTAHSYWTSVVGSELANGSGYTTNGVALTAKTLTVSTTLLTFTATGITWTFTGNKAFRYVVFYNRTPATDGTRPLLGYIDLGSAWPTLVNGDVFAPTFDPANTIIKATLSR